MKAIKAEDYVFTGAEWDVLWCLFLHGATWDGDIPCKAGRNNLIERGLAYRIEGWTMATQAGFEAAMALSMDKKKGTNRRPNTACSGA